MPLESRSAAAFHNAVKIVQCSVKKVIGGVHMLCSAIIWEREVRDLLKSSIVGQRSVSDVEASYKFRRGDNQRRIDLVGSLKRHSRGLLIETARIALAGATPRKLTPSDLRM
jgi:hypothetical protein